MRRSSNHCSCRRCCCSSTCRGNWAPEEEFLLAQCHALVGSHWSKMTKRLPGRTENSIKNFWNATLRSK